MKAEILSTASFGRCPYCGSETEVGRISLPADVFYCRCTNFHCQAEGPKQPTYESAKSTFCGKSIPENGEFLESTRENEEVFPVRLQEYFENIPDLIESCEIVQDLSTAELMRLAVAALAVNQDVRPNSLSFLAACVKTLDGED